ncbi:hypothetical protein D9619_012518 [Psilocybe cf. subviscida]|uniref:Uncharacterized protein n=1 Tax=Psilocybe cf. subviscida TaxID=2480587 RepID=A0A8H5B6Z2_9AGAR|nr:hypothetical protein D9619_012518 [Psilocybe cf. subviscida]
MQQSSDDSRSLREHPAQFDQPSASLDQQLSSLASGSALDLIDHQYRSTMAENPTFSSSHTVPQQVNVSQVNLSARPPVQSNGAGAQPMYLMHNDGLWHPEGSSPAPMCEPRTQSPISPATQHPYSVSAHAWQSAILDRGDRSNGNGFTTGIADARSDTIPRISGRRRSTQLIISARVNNRLPFHVQHQSLQRSQINLIAQEQSTASTHMPSARCGLQPAECSSAHLEIAETSAPSPRIAPTVAVNSVGSGPSFNYNIDENRYHTPGESGERMLQFSPAQVDLLQQQMREYTAFMEIARSSEPQDLCPGASSKQIVCTAPQNWSTQDQPQPEASSTQAPLEPFYEQSDQDAHRGRQSSGQADIPSTSAVPENTIRESTSGPGPVSGSGNHAGGPTDKRRKRNPSRQDTETGDAPKTKRRRRNEDFVDYGDAKTPLERARAALAMGLGGKTKKDCDPTQPIRCRLAPIPGYMPDEDGLCGYLCADSCELVAHVLAPKTPAAGQRPGHGIGGSKGNKAATAARNPDDVGICTWGDVRGCTFNPAHGSDSGMGRGKGKRKAVEEDDEDDSDSDSEGPSLDGMVVGNLARHIVTVHGLLTRKQESSIKMALKMTSRGKKRANRPARSHSSATASVSVEEGQGSALRVFSDISLTNTPFVLDDQPAREGYHAHDNSSGDTTRQDENGVPSASDVAVNSVARGQLIQLPLSSYTPPEPPFSIQSVSDTCSEGIRRERNSVATDLALFLLTGHLSNNTNDGRPTAQHNSPSDFTSALHTQSNLNHQDYSDVQAESSRSTDQSPFSFIDNSNNHDFNFLTFGTGANPAPSVGTTYMTFNEPTGLYPTMGHEFTLGTNVMHDFQFGPQGIWGLGQDVPYHESHEQQNHEFRPLAHGMSESTLGIELKLDENGSTSDVNRNQGLYEDFDLKQYTDTQAGDSHPNNAHSQSNTQTQGIEPQNNFWDELEYVGYEQRCDLGGAIARENSENGSIET